MRPRWYYGFFTESKGLQGVYIYVVCFDRNWSGEPEILSSTSPCWQSKPNQTDAATAVSSSSQTSQFIVFVNSWRSGLIFHFSTLLIPAFTKISFNIHWIYCDVRLEPILARKLSSITAIIRVEIVKIMIYKKIVSDIIFSSQQKVVNYKKSAFEYYSQNSW